MITRRLVQGGMAALVLMPWRVFGQSAKGNFRLIQGPLIGAIGPDHVSIRVRSSARTDASVVYGTRADLVGAKQSAAIAVGPDNHYFAQFDIKGLSPATRYYYRIVLDGKLGRLLRDAPADSFVTAPLAGSRTAFSVGFGSCASVEYFPEQPIWNAIERAAPDLFLWLGDNVYHDTLEPEIMDAMWAKQLSLPNLQPLLRTVPQLSIWDDHDFGLDNHDRTNPAKEFALESFKRNWANPAYGLPDTPGVFYKFTYANVDFFMLDGRYYRDPNALPDGPTKTFLGARQLQWLKDGLKASRADFKILACGSGWSNAKGPGGDTWSSALTERNALFDFIRDEKIAGVVLLSGDTHIGELNAIPWSEKGGYDLYDLVSSPLANGHSASFLDRRPERRIRQVFFAGMNFGMLNFDSSAEPTLTFSLHGESGRYAQGFSPMTLKASELRNGVSTWLEKMDPLSRKRWEQTQSGKPTYSGG